jgi:hypothetical protein
VKMEWMSVIDVERTGDGDFNDTIRRKCVDVSSRKQFLCGRCATQNLEEDRDRRREERGSVDCPVRRLIDLSR